MLANCGLVHPAQDGKPHGHTPLPQAPSFQAQPMGQPAHVLVVVLHALALARENSTPRPVAVFRLMSIHSPQDPIWRRASRQGTSAALLHQLRSAGDGQSDWNRSLIRRRIQLHIATLNLTHSPPPLPGPQDQWRDVRCWRSMMKDLPEPPSSFGSGGTRHGITCNSRWADAVLSATQRRR